MSLLSPGIQLFESSVTPAAPANAAGNGVATLGFSTRGPIGKLTKISSVSEFNEVFGKPVADHPWAHIMCQSVLANGADIYFTRLADGEAAEATCPVYKTELKGAKVGIKNGTTLDAPAGYFVASVSDAADKILTITLTDAKTVTVPMKYVSNFGDLPNVCYVAMSEVANAINTSAYSAEYIASREKIDGTEHVVIKARDEASGTLSGFSVSAGEGATSGPSAATTGSFATTSNSNTLNESFKLQAKHAGSSMNGVKVVKTTSKAFGGDESWNVEVVDTNGAILEARRGITSANFLAEMTKFKHIEVVDETSEIVWPDGTYVLGYGLQLTNGATWAKDGATLGTDGYPVTSIGGVDQYNEDVAVQLYLNALGADEFVSTDEYSFSIVATPGMQNSLVQNAAIDVCTKRGDSIYLADVPETFCLEGKQGVEDVISWANSNQGFQTSYCAVYYGWFSQVNPYDTANNINCPASCFIAPKMIALDNTAGEFFAPAGIQNGTLVVSDYLYSPDQADRDKMVGGSNIINPISFSNTRGIVVMAQKTTDRTTSPLNRVGVRRLTNLIKRNIRAEVAELMFQPNNETARARARAIVDGIMRPIRERDFIEGYTVNVVSGTGADRDTINIYLGFQPYGMIEKIYVYLNITDAGVTVEEAVA